MTTKSSSLTIRDYFEQKARAGDVGIEIEVEAKKPLPIEIGGAWLAKAEGSLRNGGIEYFTRQPLKADDLLVYHIGKLTDKLNRPDQEVDMSSRTSVHIHVNVQRMTPTQVWTMAVAYWLMEGPLSRFCGEKNRVGNLFCLGIEHAEGILKNCIKDLKSKQPFTQFPLDWVKYSGQNLSAVSRFGSLEYRTMRGTVDKDLINKWCMCLVNIREQSMRFRDPGELLQYYLDSEKDVLLNALLTPAMIEELKKQKDYIPIIRENALALAEIAYIHDNWAAWQSQMEDNYRLSKTKKDAPDAERINPRNWFLAGNQGLGDAARRLDEVARLIDPPIIRRRRTNLENME